MPNTLGAGLGNVPFPGTTIYPETVDNGYPNALCIRGWCTGTPTDTTATRYAPGCVLVQTDASANAPILWINAGTSASVSWKKQSPYSGGVTYGSVAVQTTGGTPVNLFGTTNGFSGTITGVTGYTIDGSLGTLSLAGSSGTIATVTKIVGTTLGIVAGGSLTSANVAFTATGTLQASCTGSGNGILIATFITS